MKQLTRHWRKDLMPSSPARETTNKLLEMVDDGSLNARDLALMALKWMSEDEVKEMAKANEINLEDTENEED